MIKPPNCPSIWHANGFLHLELPGHGKQCHTVKFPATLLGAYQAFKLLTSRSEASRIDEPGDATQAQINSWKPEKPKPLGKPSNPKALEILKGMGLI